MIGKWLRKWQIGLCIALIGFSGGAHSAFHLWDINEVYSNASGTVQFIEFTTSSGSQQFVANHTVTSSNGTTTNTFNIPTDLPGDSANKKFLIGTTSFAALGIVTPDYIMPDGFLFTSNLTINFAENSDILFFATLPTDGVLSVNRNMTTGTNSPTNFAGATGTIAPSSTIPDPPVIGTATAGNGQVSVTFTPPGNNGGSAINLYTATCGGQNASGPSSPLTVFGLPNGVAVTCTVRASNSVGSSNPSTPSNSVTPGGPPGTPQNVSATPGDSQVTMNFSPPNSDGGSAISSYTATCGVQSASGGGSPLTVFGLANGVNVTCTVFASNAQGNGVPSTGLNVTPATVPGAPAIGTATGGNSQVSVTFTAPGSDGGSAINGYTATCGAQSAIGPGSPLTVFGLPNGITVTCNVFASNAFGPGQLSAASNSVTPATVPGPPTIGLATPGDTQATVNFTAPGNNGGAIITGFTATCGTQSASGPGSPILVTGLVNGVAITCNVIATNAKGNSVPSAASNSVTPASLPGAPAIGAATAGNSEAFIAFSPPASNGGSAITGYIATCNPGPVTGSGALSPIKVTGLINTQLYSCAVAAINAVGTGAASATVDVTPLMNPALTPLAVFSRKTHTGVGPFDLPVATGVAIGGPVSVEPRAIGSGHNIVFLFNLPVTSFATVSVTPPGIASATPTSSNELVVTLTGVPDNQRVTLSLTDVNGAGVSVDVAIGFLVGDVSNSRSVNAGDIISIKARQGQVIDASNFRFDLNATGAVNASDVSVVKSRSGVVLP